MLKQFSVLILLLTGFIGLNAQDNNLSKELETSIKKRIENNQNVGIVIGILDSTGTHYYSFGTKTIDGKEAVDENSVFEIGSISKTFTGILLADMVLHKKMSLSDPIQKHLPNGVSSPKRDKSEITLVHLANHSSALPRMPDNFKPENQDNPYVDYTEELLYDFLSNCVLTRDIGSEHEYSNYAMALLGHILATKNEMSYEELMALKITSPLGMKNTAVDLTDNMNENLAIGYNGTTAVSNWDLGILAGAGGIRSTAVDMLKYLEANMGVGKNDIYPAMQLAHKNTRPKDASPAIGLAWFIDKKGDESYISHGGATGGYRAFAGFVQGQKKAVVVLTNSNGSVDDIGRHLLNAASPLQKIRPSIALSIESILNKKGAEAAIKEYWNLKESKADEFNFAEEELNNLGYKYIGKKDFKNAMVILDLNVKAFPEAFNAYDSRGEVHLKLGNKEQAILDYKKSVELNPANANGIAVLESLDVDTKDLVKEIEVSDEALESYLGEYELAPGFTVMITREGKQLSAQATGQPKFPVFAKKANVFYFKVVQAEITFNSNSEGEVDSITLFQGGQKMPGKKISK